MTNTIEYNGVEYTVESVCGGKLRAVEKKPTTYAIGQRFMCNHGNEYILAQVDCRQVTLIKLDDGNRWTSPVSVKNVKKITQTEFERIDRRGDMELIV